MYLLNANYANTYCHLTPDFCTLLLGKAAESKNASKALILINKRINAERGRDEPVAIQVSNVPGYTSVRPRHRKGGGKRGNDRGNTRRKKRHAYSNLGRGSRQVSKTRTNCPRVGRLGAEDTIWQQYLAPGRFKNRKAQFFLRDTKKWVAGKVHEYVSAKERNDSCDCGDAVCGCPKVFRGMYRYTFDSGRLDGSEDYFSDDDPTVKINGLTGERLWKSL